MMAVAAYSFLALTCAPLALMAAGQSNAAPTVFEKSALIQKELDALSADRIVQYLLPESGDADVSLELVFDRHEHWDTRTPATVFRFARDYTGLWKGRRVDGQIPIGTKGYWAIDTLSDETAGFVCIDDTFQVSSDAALALNALVELDWESVPQFVERDSSHPTITGVRSHDNQRFEARYLEYFISLAEVRSSKASPEMIADFEAQYSVFERHVVALTTELFSRRVDCDRSTSIREVLPEPTLDAKHTEQFEDIRARLVSVSEQITSLRNSKE